MVVDTYHRTFVWNARTRTWQIGLEQPDPAIKQGKCYSKSVIVRNPLTVRIVGQLPVALKIGDRLTVKFGTLNSCKVRVVLDSARQSGGT